MNDLRVRYQKLATRMIALAVAEILVVGVIIVIMVIA